MITRDQWNALDADAQWQLFDTLQTLEKPRPAHYVPEKPKHPPPQIRFTDEEISVPPETILHKGKGGVFSTKTVNALIRSNWERLPQRQGLTLTLTITELNEALINYGLMFWKPFADHPQHGYITIFTVLNYLMARKELPDDLLTRFQIIAENKVGQI